VPAAKTAFHKLSHAYAISGPMWEEAGGAIAKSFALNASEYIVKGILNGEEVFGFVKFPRFWTWSHLNLPTRFVASMSWI
jgi:hypothetical protein